VYPAVADVATTVTFPLCVIVRIPLAGSIVAAVPLVIFHVTVAGKVAGLLATERADEAPYAAADWLMVSVGACTVIFWVTDMLWLTVAVAVTATVPFCRIVRAPLLSIVATVPLRPSSAAKNTLSSLKVPAVIFAVNGGAPYAAVVVGAIVRTGKVTDIGVVTATLMFVCDTARILADPLETTVSTPLPGAMVAMEGSSEDHWMLGTNPGTGGETDTDKVLPLHPCPVMALRVGGCMEMSRVAAMALFATDVAVMVTDACLYTVSTPLW
jgi:hypothetical protein